ncbi:Uncharacterized RNA pseudouridine synthase RT0532 [Candidatus Xenohaliotis californiensis]|uniref:Uncharacterized RNA pseudouridine synthase RT0532 n=1 Tax=Candidatus Xenohaliotis californiensis TaxID=84677 RepID=A0ABP0EU36_9RICK|nr:Uncharacterized RNA pseudouridine synthase RT0532 [Candidatus Xenohaliotis californiensis]
MKLRLAKFISRSGYCSRREAERLIAAGMVTVDGARTNVDEVYFIDQFNKVLVCDNLINHSPIKTRLWLYHKPRGVLVSKNDPFGRSVVFDHLPSDMPHTVAIGRLDYNSEGLLLLTNNPLFAHYMSLPNNGVLRVYKILSYGSCLNNLKSFELGVKIDGVIHKAHKIYIKSKDGKLGTVVCKLLEGKNREIRKVFNLLGCSVKKLLRVSYGDFQLNGIAPNHIVEVENKKLQVVCNKLTGYPPV